MLRPVVQLPLWAALLCPLALAQDVVYSCQAPAEINRLSIEQVRVRLADGQDDFFTYKRLLDVTPSRPRPGSLAAEFQQKLQQHPDDARFLYLYSRALIGKDTPQAIIHLNRAVEAAPKLPWTYPALAHIYASRNFRNRAKSIANLLEYRKLCPGNLDAYRYSERAMDAALTAPDAVQLRAVLEGAKDPNEGPYWSTLWKTEFGMAPAAEYDALRKRVAADVDRLKTRPEPRNRDFLLALADGYRLSGQTEAAEKIEKDLDIDLEAHKAREAWESKYQTRTRTMTEEEHRAAMEDLSRVATEWVKRWPSSLLAWQTRLNTMSLQPNWTKEEMEKAGEEVLRIEKGTSLGWTMVPQGLRVAQQWVRHRIRPRDCVALGEASLAQIALGPEVESDLTAPRNAADIAAAKVYGFDTTTWDAMIVVMEGSLQLDDYDKARLMLSRMRQWLNDNQSKRDDPTSGYMQFEARYLHSAGEAAEAQGHKLDALALYLRATALGSGNSDATKHARAMWDEQGGTKAGWELAVQRLPAPVPRESSGFTVATPAEAGSWKRIGRALPATTLTDTAGKTWTVANFRGKRIFINLWATWCAPCRDELPYVQKLYELVRERPDVQLITFNLDENPGEVQPFLTEYHYTFPVVLARSYVLDFSGGFSIPENWLIDRAGILRQKSTGFDLKIANWPNLMLEKLAQVVE